MKTKEFFIVSVVLLSVWVLSGCVLQEGGVNISEEQNRPISPYEGKRILYIDSYHEGYEWSDGITEGVIKTLEGTGVELKIHRMDTKRNPDEEFKKKAALDAKKVIEGFDPDVVITSDDNAFKYLIMPYYKDADLPVVFNGLNWDASVYGAPYSNTAGMVEVSLTVQLIETLKEYADGEKVGYLSADVLTERKNLEYYSKLFNLNFDKQYFVTNMGDWKDKYLKLQDEVDIVIFENSAGITDWDEMEAETFALDNIKVPVGTTNPWVMQSSLLGLTKVPYEQGEWAAQTALEIVDGKSPSDIPLVTNKKGGVLVNLKVADKLGVIVSSDLLKNAEFIE